MVTKRPLSWFLTDQGRKVSFAIITGTGIALTSAKFVPHTFLLERYKKFVHYYSNGQPVKLSDELQQQYQKCLDILNVSDVHRKLISPFSVFGYDLFHAGSCNSRFGGVIGIPVNFKYKTIEDLKNDDVQVNQKKIDWTSEDGKKLANALILPEKVQQFAMCREILMTMNNKVLFESTYPFMCIFFVYNMAAYLNKKLNLYAAPIVFRSTLYFILGLFGIGTYSLMKDMTQIYYETSVDKQICELGPEYIESGVVFYDKLLKRNQALRALMGSEGESKYTKLGNENYLIRQPHIALVHRKKFFEEQLKQLQSTEDILEDSEKSDDI